MFAMFFNRRTREKSLLKQVYARVSSLFREALAFSRAARRDKPLGAQDGSAGLIQLVGAGPGAADLLTLRALKAIQTADVILYDRLVGEDILSLAPKAAVLLYVGKIGRGASTPQQAIQDHMIAEAVAGKRVVRLKGGDPFIFGRGGEELEAARAAGIPVEVIPGVSAALGAAAAVQTPLTHRDHARTLIFATGHARDGAGDVDLDWRALADARATVAIYMGVATADLIAGRLIQAGRPPQTPAAVIENATLPAQKVLRTQLLNLAQDMRAAGIAGPAILLIGDAAAASPDPALTLQQQGVVS